MTISTENWVVLQRWLATDWANRFGQIVEFYHFFYLIFKQNKNKYTIHMYTYSVRYAYNAIERIGWIWAFFCGRSIWWMNNGDNDANSNRNNFAVDAQSICIEHCRRTTNTLTLGLTNFGSLTIDIIAIDNWKLAYSSGIICYLLLRFPQNLQHNK